MDGVLVIDKPAGPTSHDVVQVVKRVIGARKVGHLGTLDPAATGVLPLCVDGATRRASELAGGEKIYSFRLILGATTDTDDDTGTILSRYPVNGAHIDCLPVIVGQFIGEIFQMPPRYSARKVNGKRMYKLARRGIVVDGKPRRILIHEITIGRVEGNVVQMQMRCGEGTYVRALCRDVGNKLGCGGHAASIRRLQSGRFTLEHAVALSDIEWAWRDTFLPLSVITTDPLTNRRRPTCRIQST